MAQQDYEITYEKGGKQRKVRVTREDGNIDCPGCGGNIWLHCSCGTKALVKRVSQKPYKARC